MKRFSLRMPDALHEKLRWESFKTGKSINELILNELKEKYGEGLGMEKTIIEILKGLDEEALLNKVGENIARKSELFSETLEMMADYFEGQTKEMVEEKLSTSSLVGADENLAIQEWIAEEEVKNIEIDEYIVFETTEIKNNTIAILLDNENMEAYEAVYDEEQDDWETDFDYDSLGIDSFDVAGALDFQRVEKMGYTFVE